MIYEVSAKEPTETKHQYNEHQAGILTATPEPDGIAFKAKFTNDRTFDGDHFSIDIAVLDEQKNPIAAVQFKAGLNGTFGGGTTERELPGKAQLPPEVLAKATYLKMDFDQFDKVNDGELWKSLAEIALKFLYSQYDDEEQNEPD